MINSLGHHLIFDLVFDFSGCVVVIKTTCASKTKQQYDE